MPRVLWIISLALLIFLGSPSVPGRAGEPVAAPPTHWAFRTPVRPVTPAVRDTAWVRTPPDAFVLAGQQLAFNSKDVAPAPPLSHVLDWT